MNILNNILDSAQNNKCFVCAKILQQDNYPIFIKDSMVCAGKCKKYPYKHHLNYKSSWYKQEIKCLYGRLVIGIDKIIFCEPKIRIWDMERDHYNNDILIDKDLKVNLESFKEFYESLKDVDKYLDCTYE